MEANLAKLGSPLIPLIIRALFPRLRHLLRELRSLPIAMRLQLEAEAKLRAPRLPNLERIRLIWRGLLQQPKAWHWVELL
jgi:hypothetical protein